MEYLQEPEESAMAAKTIETKILLLCLAALLTIEVATKVSPPEGTHYPMLILGGARVVEILLFLLIVSIWGKGMSSMGMAGDQVVPGLKKGLIWSAVFGVCALLGFVILYVANVNPLGLIKTHLPSGTWGIVLFFVVGGLVAPIAEEVFFRGIVYGFLRRWGVLVALAGSTAVFVLAHAIHSWIPFTQIVGGIVFAVAYERTGNLMVPITVHVLGNTAIFALSLVP